MKARIASVAIVAFMLLVLVLLAWGSSEPETAEAAPSAPIVNCQDTRISLSQVRIRCDAAGLVVLNTVVNLPLPETVTLPPLPGATIHVPGPTRTVEVIVPGDTETVQIPGATKTVTASPSAGPTDGPPTETITVSPSGQEPSKSDTLGPRDPVVSLPGLPDVYTIKKAVGLGLLATLFLMALILLAMWGGYVLGFKDKEAKETDFLKALLDTTRAGKHR